MAIKPLVRIVTMGLGIFVSVEPHRAAKIWGSQQLANLACERRALFIRWYRAFVIFLFLAGVLLAVDSIVLSTHHH